ncbi:tape measure protein [Fructobacillus tropaeoli]|uniref:tape measure protein n=1 Tax=Fructobacillus tropaeoli TaxID=709323 RepID=UPI0019414512|nr:tape measure protein [Fructobacillus tropaeoli]GIC69561.1 hypothetical protein FT12353_01980 [Fructobacillus tropaeoli]
MAKITNEMATKLSLDTTSASKTLKEFTDDVKKSTNEWKVQEAQMRSAGDQLGASKAKYEGLTTAVEKQTTKVESLKQALANTNTSTEKGQKLQGMLTAELAKAERQLNSYNGQLDRAEQSYKYQSSGMAKLNDDIKHNTELTEANVKQLKAEGKENEANKVKLEGLAKNRESLNGILKIQQAELDKLASSGDKNSEAYKKQELRVAQMKAKIAEANSEIRTMNSHGIKINTSSLDKVNERLAKMNERVNKSGHLFGKVFGANIVSAAFVNGLASSKAHLVDALKAGTDFNKEQQVMGATWNTLTGSAEKGKDMVNSINSMSKAFGQSNDVVNELQQQFYHVFNQKEPTEKLTGSMLTLADTLGMNSEEVERLGLNFTHMMSSSKLQLGDFNMISDQLPMYGEKLLEYEKEVQHNSNLTMEQLRKQMSDGKISAQDATNVINELGDKYKDASENMMSTFTGMQRRIKAQSHVLAGSITRPLLETKNPLFKAVSDWVADDRTVNLFDKFGQQLSKTFNTITSAFGKSFKSKDFDEFVNHAMVNATNAVERFGNYVAKHSDDIIKLAQGIKAVGGAALSTGGMMMKLLVPMLMKAGELATKHKTTFKILAGTVLALGVAFKGTLAVMKGFTIINNGVKAFKALGLAIKSSTVAQKALNVAVKASVIGLIVTAIAGLILGLVELYKHNKKFKKFVDDIVKGSKKLFEGVIKWFKKLPKEIGKLFKGVINFFKKDWKEIALFIVNPIGGAIALLYKHFKPFREFIDGIGKFFKNVFDSMADGVKSSLKTIHNVISNVINAISNIWNSVWNGVSSFFGNIWKGMSKFTSNTINGMHDVIKGVLDKIGNTWNGMWSGLSDFFGGIWKDIKGFAQDGINGVLKIINGGIDAIDSVWKFFTGHETSVHHLKPVKFERGGVVETRMSMVNDGKGENWKELIQLPNGQLKMSNKRDHVLPLPVGTQIYNGDQTKQIMQAAGVEKYANGGIVGSVVSAAKGVGEWVGDKYEMVTKFLKDPLKNVTDLIVKGTKGMYDGLHSFGDMAHGVFDNLYNPIADWFKKGLEAIKSSLGRNAPSGSGVERWRDQVIDALKENGMSTESWAVNKILKQISTESSGNEEAVQGGYTDINTKTGDLAKGLMQTISATFNRYAFPGHKNIFNGYDNLLAAIAYIKNRYGMNMSGIGEGHGYANGGLVSRHQIAQIAEGNKPEMIIPLDSMKSSRGFELLGKTAVAMAARDGQSSQNTNDNSEVVGKMDQMITLLSMILGVNKEQLSSGSQNSGLKAVYEQMARDNTIRNYQSI